MPYQISWVVPRRVLFSTFSGTISHTELHEYVAEMRREFPTGEKPVYHISDSRAMGKVQLSLKALAELVKASTMFSSMAIQIDVNRQRAFNTFLVTFSTQIMKLETHIVPTVEDGIALLCSIDASLPPPPWNLAASYPASAASAPVPPIPAPPIPAPNAQPSAPDAAHD